LSKHFLKQFFDRSAQKGCKKHVFNFATVIKNVFSVLFVADNLVKFDILPFLEEYLAHGVVFTLDNQLLD